MDKEIKLQAIPNNLELTDWLKYSLTSNDELSRQIALEEMITNGMPSEFTELLTNISESDSSKNCRSQALWLLKLSENKSTLKSLIKKLAITPNFVNLQIQKGDYTKLTLLSQILRKSPPPQTLELWRETLNNSTEPILIQIGLDILCKFGEAKDTSYALKHINSQSPEVVCSALSLLAKQDQDLLKKYIKIGLTSKNENVLLHSIHLLKQIDETEAIKYLRLLILNKNTLVRQKALRELMLINFEKVEDLFWQYISREEEPFLLVKAGLLATFNPKQYFPFKIYDILLTASKIKQYILQLILKQTVETANASGILAGKSINSYMNEIKHYIDRRKTEQAIRVYVSNLKSNDTKLRANAVEKLYRYISNPQIKSILEKQYKIETDSAIKSDLAAMMEDESGNEPIKLASFPDSFEFLQLKPKEQRSILKKINSIEEYPLCKKTLFDILNSEIKKTVLLDILIIISKFGNSNDVGQIYFLTKSEDNSIVAQAIKTIGTIDLDKILPDLNKYLANEDPRIKSAAFELYILADKQAAIQYVGNMLKNPQDPIRQIGLSLLPLLDYPSAEPLLWWMLDHETNIELQNQIGYMIAANPTKDGLIKLFLFTHNKNGELKEGLKDMWNVAVFSAQNVLNLTKEEIEKECWDNTVRIEEEEKKAESDYKFKSVVDSDIINSPELDSELGVINQNNNNSFLEKILFHFYQFKYHYIIFIIILDTFIYIMSDGKPINTISSKNKKAVKAKEKFISNEPVAKTTQVGTEDWTEGIKSGARSILRSKAYTNIVNSVSSGQNLFLEEAARYEKQYYEKIYNDPNASQEDRDWAQTKISDNFQAGMRAFEAGNYNEAKYYLEKIAEDSTMNTYGRIEAMQKLIEIYNDEQDKVSWTKWMDKMLKEAKKSEFYAQLDVYDSFKDVLSQIESAQQLLKTDQQVHSEAIKSFKEQYNYSDEEAQKAVDNIINFKYQPY